MTRQKYKSTRELANELKQKRAKRRKLKKENDKKYGHKTTKDELKARWKKQEQIKRRKALFSKLL